MDYDGTDISEISQEELVERMNQVWNSLHVIIVPIFDEEVDACKELDALMLELSKRNQ